METIIFFKGNNYSQYLSVGDFIVVGDKNILSSTTADYIVSNTDQNLSVSQLCYEKTSVSRYYLFTRLNNCKKN